MDRSKAKRIQQIVVCICIAAVIVFLAVMPMFARQKPANNDVKASILSGTVKAGSLNRELIGGGVLAEEAAVAISVPSAVKLTDFLLRNGDAVTKGTPIASVDRVTVMTAISQVQETLDHLAQQIKKAADAGGEESVTAEAGGTVKILHAQKGDSVQSVMLEHGALAVLSLDNLLAVDLVTDSDIRVGKPMTVTLPGGKTVTGRVAKNLNNLMTVTIEDQGYKLGDVVEVTTSNGVYLGSNGLYIYSPWNATAYAGTIESVNIRVGDRLRAGDTLMTLADVGYTPAYRQLVDQRQEYEALMLQLFQMYQTEVLTASCDGLISGIDLDSPQLLSDSGTGYTLQLLANAPNGNDEILYANYVGKVTAVGSNGWSLLVNPQPVEIADYTDLSGVPVEDKTMTQVCTYPTATQAQEDPDTPAENETPPTQPESLQTAPIYELKDGVWQQLVASDVVAGDILLFAADDKGEFVWIVRIKTASNTPSTPSRPGGNGNFGGMTGGYPAGGTTKPKPEFQLYALDMTQVAQITPQTTMTLTIAVDELDILALSEGMNAQVKIDALGGEKHNATITAIDNTGANNGGSSKYAVTLTLERTKRMLAGMNGTATLVLSQADDVLTVPAKALVEKGNQTLIYTGYDEKSEELLDPVPVKTGRSDGENVEILEGLSEGQTYHYAYYDTLEISFTPDFSNTGFLFG